MSLTDSKSTFEKLIRNGTAQDFVDHHGREFTFDTVFHITPYSYRCCPCAFEHEYFDYLSEDGNNEDMLDRTLHSVDCGRCPHVEDSLSWQYKKTTGVRTEHIASAVGMVPPQDRFSRCTTEIFEIDPHMIAVLKRHVSVVDKYNRYFVKLSNLTSRGMLAQPWEGGSNWKLQEYLMYTTRSPGNLSEISMKLMTVPEVCVKMNEPLLLGSLKAELFMDFDLTLALKWAFRDKLKGMQNHLVDKIREAKYDGIFSSIVATVVYDEPDILTDLAQLVLTMCDNDEMVYFKEKLSVVCHFLKREKCAAVLERFGLIDDHVMPADQLSKLEKLLKIFSMFPERLSDEIKTILLKTPKAVEYINDTVTLSQFSNTTVVKTLGEAGCNLNQERQDGDTVVTSLLYCIQHDSRYRELRPLLEVLLYQNFDVADDSSSVKRAIIVDSDHYMCDMSTLLMGSEELSHTYTMDGKEHTPYGHEGQNFALNFAAPLLLECGYTTSTGILKNALKKKLHPEEIKYFQRYLYSPKSLSWGCCMALRKHFKGRTLHRFVEAANIPESISDQLIFKNVLKCV